MARRGGGPPITLFSFQDIITSVSGIMIFVTLLLALELSQKSSSPSASAGGKAAERDAGDLRARIAEARAELEVLRRRALVDGRPSLAEERAAREAADRVDAAERELAALERRAAEARSRAVEAKTREAGADGRREELRRARAEVEGLRRKLERIRDGDYVYFNVDADRGARRNGWLALIDGKALTVAPLGRAQKPRAFEGASTGTPEDPSPAARAFLAWAARDARNTYILLVARPSGIGRVDLIRDVFDRQGHPYGLDLVTEAQDVLDPETGVHRP